MSTALKAAAVVFVAAITACGGKVVVDGGGGPSSAPGSGSSSAGSGGSEGSTPCVASDGVRLCGGDKQQCPPLDPPVCPGFGCTPALDVSSFAPDPAGVCWSDLPGGGLTPCVSCADGQVCVQRAPDELLCADPAVCAALFQLGATTACRYADKTAYDGQALPDAPSACPVASGSNALCGGGCGECSKKDFYICTGRSPTHPFGACAQASSVIESSVQAAPCQPGSTDVAAQCFGGLCAVFDTPPESQSAARKYGFCMNPNTCKLAAAKLPGGLTCFDRKGNQVAP